ncbi:telomerase Cajal body protein 1, partial [Vespula squamosa]
IFRKIFIMESESISKTSLVEDENKLHMEIELINPAIENISINPIFIKETENKQAQSSNNETNVDAIQRPNITNDTNEMSIDHALNIDESDVSSELNIEKIEANLCEETEIYNVDSTSKNTTNNSFCSYNWTVSPKLICAATKEYQPTAFCENFTKGCQWSPDGTCLLVPSEDFRIRLYELPRALYSGEIPSNFTTFDLKAALVVKEGGLIYDSCWYPFMNSWDPATCCFLSTSKESPIHLWDAFTGKLRATYRAYNDVDEVKASISVQFIDSGKQILCGFKNTLQIFDTNRPGRQITTINFKKDFPNTSGLVSCIRENPLMPGLVAFGTYSKSIGLYKDTPICTFKTANGVTQVEFSPCGTKLYSAVRRNNEFLCWDLRNPGVLLYSFQKRQADTNQKIQFDITNNGHHVISGGTDGKIVIWELFETENYKEDVNPKCEFKVSEDCVNGVSVHKNLPIIATSSGQRIYDTEEVKRDNSVRLWWFN